MIRQEGSGPIPVVWLDRPAKRNALTPPMIAALRDRVVALGHDPAVSAFVIAGSGPSTCAGVDLHEFAGGTPDSVRGLIDLLAEACAAIRRCPKPVGMAVRGHCLGAALELACACDVRVAADDALLGMPEVFLGIPSVIDAALIERHVGLGRAQELILTGEPVGAARALEWGLVSRVVTARELIDACRRLLERITRHDGATIARQKQLFAAWQNLPLDDAIEHSKAALAESFADGLPQRLAQERLQER